MKIEILHNSSCGFWTQTHADVQKILTEGNIKADIDVSEVTSEEEAKEKRFFGSPQVNIDGADVDPLAAKMTNFHVSGCRMYMYGDKVHDGPPYEMLKKAIAEAVKS